MTTENEFLTIHDEYYPKITRYLTGMVGSNDAEDIAQDVFNKISRNLAGFRGQSKLSTWIYRIATNTAIDWLRSAAHKHSAENSVFEEAAKPENRNDLNARDHVVTDQKVIRKEMSECVKEFINNLPPDYRTVIVLSELEGLGNQEIADILEISLDNVKVRLHRAKAKLKQALSDGCDFYHNEQNTLACDRKQSRIISKMPK